MTHTPDHYDPRAIAEAMAERAVRAGRAAGRAYREAQGESRPSDEHLQRAVALLAQLVAGWTEVYVAPPTDQDERAARDARQRLSAIHQRAEGLLAAMGVDIPEAGR